jgi:hypothetical protein
MTTPVMTDAEAADWLTATAAGEEPPTQSRTPHGPRGISHDVPEARLGGRTVQRRRGPRRHAVAGCGTSSTPAISRASAATCGGK